MSRIQVVIDKLVLRGIAPGDRKHLVEALQAELSRVLSDPRGNKAWRDSSRTPVIKLGQITFTPGSSGSRNLGRAIARGIGRRMQP